MKAEQGPFHPNSLRWLVFLVALLAVTTVAALLVQWRAPGLELAARGWLWRMRGTLPPSEQLVIVAIDEASLARLGRHPWPRRLMAQALAQLSAAQPKALTLDVLYAEATAEPDDQALVTAIKRAGKVVLATQLTRTANEAGEPANAWVGPLPSIAQAAAGIGHANVITGTDGVARSLLVRLIDDEATPHWALALETLRVGLELNPTALCDTPAGVQLGERLIPVNSATTPSKLSGAAVKTWQAAQLDLDFAGPPGSFAAQTVSFQDVLAGRVPSTRFRDNYVLIGATAAALGDRVASPFTRAGAGIGADEEAEFMPGVEVLANALNTLLQRRFYHTPSVLVTALLAALTAAATALALSLAQGRYEAVKHLLALAVLLCVILMGSYLAFAHWLIWPPLVPLLTAFLMAAPLSLLQRSLTLSANLDRRIAEVSQAGAEVLTTHPNVNNDASVRWPRGGAWKAQQLGFIAGQLAARARFVEQSMRAVEDGLLVADVGGRITFANRRAAEMLGRPAQGWQALAGADLFETLAEATPHQPLFAPETRRRLLEERTPFEGELALGQRQYILRLAAVLDATEQTTLGLVASLADITKQHELQQARDGVLALVTHELKTPLTAIQAMSEVLAQFDVDATRRRTMHLAINDEAQRLAALIDEYLSLTRLETGAQRLRLTAVQPALLLERTLLLLEPLAAQRGIQLVRCFAPGLPVLQADADWLARAITNLIANALKFSPAQTSVRVSAAVNAGEFCLAVADQGCGIPAEALAQVFEKFYRVPRAPESEDEVPGHGLGLALVREIAEQHGGRVTVDSTPGVGSTFTLWLPL